VLHPRADSVLPDFQRRTASGGLDQIDSNAETSLEHLNRWWSPSKLREEKAAERFFDFFAANIRNKNTRRAYYKAICRFSECCEGEGLSDLAEVKPLHLAAYPDLDGVVKRQRKGPLMFNQRPFWFV
jgi:hypothetical protein